MSVSDVNISTVNHDKSSALARVEEQRFREGENLLSDATGTRWGRQDWIVAVALLVFAVLYSRPTFLSSMPPYEDAAMLMRYSQNLADGHGIVWNVGEAPVDGATDFLFMAAVAGIVRTGVAIEPAVRLLTVGAHVLTVVLVYLSLRAVSRVGRFVAVACALYLLVGNGLNYAQHYFGTTVFAFVSAIGAVCALRVIARPTWSTSAGFAFASLLMGLVRPEGVFLAGFLLGSVALMLGWRLSLTPCVWFASVFATLGLGYFLWRGWYFGYLLPNPFYKKGGGHLYLSSLESSIIGTLKLIGVIWVFPAAACLSRENLKAVTAAILPIVGFAGIWLFLSQEMNYLDRFQYATFPLALILFPPLTTRLTRQLRLPSIEAYPRNTRVAFTVFLTLGVLYGLKRLSFINRADNYEGNLVPPIDTRLAVARKLAAYQSRGYIMSVTEAGLLPLYSQWRAIDSWGLNDQFIAHHGGITPQYIDEKQPAIIMFQATFLPTETPTVQGGDAWTLEWSRMTVILRQYAESHQYILASAYAHGFWSGQRHLYYWYVKPGLPDSQAIIDIIRSTPDPQLELVSEDLRNEGKTVIVR